MKTTLTLIQIRKYARQLMDQHGFSHVPFRWDAASRRAGAVHYLPYRNGEDPYRPSHLSLSRKLIPSFTDEAITNTILHEIAHLMTPGDQHGPAWRAAAISIGCDGERCYNLGESLQSAQYVSNIVGQYAQKEPVAMTTPEPTFRGEYDLTGEPILHCPVCNLGILGYTALADHCSRLHPSHQSLPSVYAEGLMDYYLRYEEDTYERRPSAEEGHTKRCYARSAISAIENMRDAEEVSDFDFAVWMQDAGPRWLAQDYLNESCLSDCLCDQIVQEHSHDWLIQYRTWEGTKTIWVTDHWYGTQTDAIQRAEDLGVLFPEYQNMTVGRVLPGSDASEVSLFWSAIPAAPASR